MMKSNVNTKWLCMLGTGLLYIVTVCIAYLPSIIKNGMYEFELTFVSNTIAGLLFMYGGIFGIIKKRDLPQICYHLSAINLLIVFLVSIAFFHEMNFSGPYVFLHIINPILSVIEFLAFTSSTKMANVIKIMSSLIFPIIYITYAIIYGYLSGYWLYGFINIPERGVIFVGILLVIIGIGIVFLSWSLYKINYLISCSKKTK